MLLGAGWDFWHEMEVLGVESIPGPAPRCDFVAGKAQVKALCSQRGPVHLCLQSHPSPAAELSHGSTTGACSTCPQGGHSPVAPGDSWGAAASVDKQLLQTLLPLLPAPVSMLVTFKPCSGQTWFLWLPDGFLAGKHLGLVSWRDHIRLWQRSPLALDSMKKKKTPRQVLLVCLLLLCRGKCPALELLWSPLCFQPHYWVIKRGDRSQKKQHTVWPLANPRVITSTEFPLKSMDCRIQSLVFVFFYTICNHQYKKIESPKVIC